MYSGFIIPIAWPETFCKQAGAWYDPLMRLVGFNEGNYYRVGHAALVLVNGSDGVCHYFDFGRYHAPAGHGRVRDAETDHDLRISTKADIQDGQLMNLRSILSELADNPSTHGNGPLHASALPLDFDRAFATAKRMQHESPHTYGPFVLAGTNCSRFVRSVALAGRPPLPQRIRLSIPLMLTPTPMHNVGAAASQKMVVNGTEIGSVASDQTEMILAV